MQFNVLVTTYEFIMKDRPKLAKIEWKYIIIDEAQRLKERQSKLSRCVHACRSCYCWFYGALSSPTAPATAHHTHACPLLHSLRP